MMLSCPMLLVDRQALSEHTTTSSSTKSLGQALRVSLVKPGAYLSESYVGKSIATARRGLKGSSIHSSALWQFSFWTFCTANGELSDNQQHPQSARQNNFPGEQLSWGFLLLSENLSVSNY